MELKFDTPAVVKAAICWLVSAVIWALVSTEINWAFMCEICDDLKTLIWLGLKLTNCFVEMARS